MNGMVGDDKFFNTIEGHAYTFTVECTAKCGDGPSANGGKGWLLHFFVNNITGVASILGSPVKQPLGSTVFANENSWDINPVVDGAFVKLEATGFAGETIWWHCSVRGSEVGLYIPA
jgi:hypothetical protein